MLQRDFHWEITCPLHNCLIRLLYKGGGGTPLFNSLSHCKHFSAVVIADKATESSPFAMSATTIIPFDKSSKPLCTLKLLVKHIRYIVRLS